MNPVRQSILALVGVALAGCSQSPPLDRIVPSESASALEHWREKVQDDLTTAQWQDFDVALQEIEFKIVADPNAKGADPVEAKVRAAIAGHTVRDVMRLGFESKLARLDAEGAQLEEFIRMNAKTKSGTAQSAVDFKNQVYTQLSLLSRVDEEMERTGQKLDLLLQRPHVVHKPRQPLP
jgi:hypothetical protein